MSPGCVCKIIDSFVNLCTYWYLCVDICACICTLYGTGGGGGEEECAFWHSHQAIIFLYFWFTQLTCLMLLQFVLCVCAGKENKVWTADQGDRRDFCFCENPTGLCQVFPGSLSSSHLHVTVAWTSCGSGLHVGSDGLYCLLMTAACSLF